MDPRRELKKLYTQQLGFLAGIPAIIPAGLIVAPEKLRDEAIGEFRSTLRHLTDQWIDSGRSDGNEEPWKRSVRYTSSTHPESIESTLTRFWKRNPPEVTFHGDQAVLWTQAALNEPTLAQLANETRGKALQRAREHALTHFVSLMDSPSRYRLFRCDVCRLYFVKARMPRKRTLIKTGSHCDHCRNEASKRRVYVQRDARRTAMIGWAADALVQWKPDRRHGELAIWIARQVNKRLPAGWRPIDQNKTNWFTRYRGEIETEVIRRKHVKG
jgi:hypothetical protein